MMFHNVSYLVVEPLWYTSVFSEEMFIETWISVAKSNLHDRLPPDHYYTCVNALHEVLVIQKHIGV
jgi:hypothetical protein